MRALTLPEVPAFPRVSEVDKPRPESGEVLVAVASSSVNGFDAATAAGFVAGMMEHRFPLILGKDLAGTVIEVGADVEGYAVGDQVFGVVVKPFVGTGSLAQYVTVSATYGLLKIPDGLAVRAAGALGLAGTAALDSVDAVAPEAGETVLVSGATGGVGALAVQLVAARGAKVIATARSGAEAEFVTGLGVEVELVDYAGDVAEQVRAIAPDGVDAVLHLAGDGAQLAALLGTGGRIASLLDLSADDVAGDLTVHAIMADPKPQTLAVLAELATTGALQVPVTASYPLEQADQAFAAFGAGTLGKVAVTVP